MSINSRVWIILALLSFAEFQFSVQDRSAARAEETPRTDSPHQTAEPQQQPVKPRRPFEQLPGTGEQQPLSLRDTYRRLLPSTCWIIGRSPKSADSLQMGTGWVCDGERRLVITNEHVIEGLDHFEVYFPHEVDGSVTVDPQYYLKQLHPIKAIALDRDARRDLALLQLESLPATAKPLRLAAGLPQPGERVATIAGLPEGSEGLWIMTTGIVRLSYRRSHANGALAGVVETDLPFNRGNSGGPVVNEAGELVAVVEGFVPKARQVSMTIDANEVKAYLRSCTSLVSPQTDQAFYVRGTRRHNAGRLDLAAEDYTQAIRLNPDHISARLNRGWIFKRKADYQTAIQEFNDVLLRDPESAAGYDGRGTCHRELGDYKAAIEDLTQAIRRAATDPQMYFRRANTYRRTRQWKPALADMDRAVELDPDHPEFLGSRGQLHRELKNFDQAAQDIEAAWKLEPGKVMWCFELGCVFSDQGDNNRAYALYTAALQMNDQETRFYNNRGIVLNRMKRHDEALRDYLKAIELKPDRALYFAHAGDTLVYLARLEDALTFFSKAIELAPTNSTFYRKRGECLAKLGNREAADKDFAESQRLKKAPDKRSAVNSGGSRRTNNQ